MEQLVLLVEEKLKEIFEEERKRSTCHQFQAECIDIMEKFVMGPGKRLRPLSLLLFFIGGGGKIEEQKNIIRTACAMELLHDSTLAHDDIMDEDEMRRNAPTIVKTFYDKYIERNKEDVKTEKFLFMSRGTTYASSLAIMTGNILYSMAQRLCLESGTNIAEMVLELFSVLNYGQILDMSGLNTVEEYNLNIIMKTAIFFKTTASIGLTLAEDDLLDIDPLNGKLRKMGNDIKEGKKTAVVWTALKEGVLSKEEKEFVEGILKLNEKAFDNQEAFTKFLNILRGKPSEVVRQEIKGHHQKALDALKQLQLKEDGFSYLKQITDLLLH
ncbi:bifunctional short chain isoprenyl diphosphate synthase, putative [Entamoeba histolytica HM-1:IMSS]|uniref:Bifunctional short chain isoprenyl diphosphate synthase, putative n=2 Tax=Entamoeba histolytica TaxID=5759 RepID=B1N3Y5_ENTH1|nr:bifunctional short chain isoprenyl diphosphate synthase, putative [Entamoeba histolytica HM-1:IMSS]EDS89325.1 bifunctional short chain isoprenyl diphosphate synthase, putative [Entamoeba histolytica HM-1:IMSS]|eukprot:XP_001913900.1 bifunctional short chain isoprenyl diphosphate synthase, putative [Entamoeba histolytica HM-1:IMSS]